MVSDLTRMESLVGPFKSGDKAVENNFRSFFGASDVQVACINAAVCERAAEIRAKFNFRPMDSLHLAAAVIHGAAIFLTNDMRLSTFTDINMVVL
jgi:predicted nucleic acid-binding protein